MPIETAAENFLENSVSPYTVEILSESDTDISGKLFGHYKIIREIGRGGMGAVFFAERADGEFEQQVALKIVRQTIIDSDTKNQFRRERQILASLNHPNIAKLLDGGVSVQGEPFLAMEYIEGATLIDYAENKNLSIDERLKLFLKIASAIAFAHRNLIVHRDIKPSNILITDGGEPKLLDFGLAKILDFGPDDAQTASAFRAMTPAYASPEQMRGDTVTTASDIYSLGVVLYELLTGSRPFEWQNSNSFEAIVHQISTSEPTRPSAVQNQKSKNKKQKSPNVNPKLLRGDLDNIVLMALRKEPARRYQSIEHFADDVKRYLENLPVKARPNTFNYRAGKFVSRNKIGVAAAFIILLSIIGGIAATVWQARRAEAEKNRAEKRFNDVRKLSTSLLFEISPQIERLPSSTQARETIVKRALEYLDSLATEATTDESLQSELASAYEQVGNVQGKPGNPNLGDLRGAIISYLKAQVIRRNLTEKHPDNFETERLLAANYYSLGDLRWWSSETDEALNNYGKAISICETLAAEQPQNSEVSLDIIRAQMAIAKVHSGNGKYEDSIPLYRRAIDSLEILVQKNPSDTEVLRLAAGCHINLAYDLSWKEEMKEAGEEVQKSLAIGEPLFAAHPNDTKLRHNLWYSYYFAGSVFQEADPTLAQKFLEKSVNLAKDAAENDKLDYQLKQDLAQSYSLLGDITDTEKHSERAIGFFQKALVILDELTKNEPQHSGYFFDLANTYTRLGTTQREANDLENARKSFENALAIQEKMREKDSADNMQIRAVAFSNENLGQVYERMKQCEKAELYFQKSYEIFLILDQKKVLSDYDKKRIDKQKSVPVCSKK